MVLKSITSATTTAKSSPPVAQTATASTVPLRMLHLQQWLLNHPLFLIAVSSLGFSTQALFVKLLARSDFGSFETVLFRGLCQASGVACVLIHWREPCVQWLGRTKIEMTCLALRGIFGFVGIAFSFLAIQTTSLANSQVTAQTTPVFTAILSSVFLREPWRVPEIMATIAATVGVLLVFQPTFIFGGRINSAEDEDGEDLNKDVLGIVFALIGALGAAGAYIMIRVTGTTVSIPWPKLMLAQAAGQFTFSVPAVFVTPTQHFLFPSIVQLGYLLSCGLLGFLSQICMTIGMQRVKAASGSLMRQSGIVYAFIYQLLLVPSEALTLPTCIGAVVITLSVSLLAYWKSQEKQLDGVPNGEIIATSHDSGDNGVGDGLDIDVLEGESGDCCEASVGVDIIESQNQHQRNKVAYSRVTSAEHSSGVSSHDGIDEEEDRRRRSSEDGDIGSSFSGSNLVRWGSGSDFDEGIEFQSKLATATAWESNNNILRDSVGGVFDSMRSSMSSTKDKIASQIASISLSSYRPLDKDHRGGTELDASVHQNDAVIGHSSLELEGSNDNDGGTHKLPSISLPPMNFGKIAKGLKRPNFDVEKLQMPKPPQLEFNFNPIRNVGRHDLNMDKAADFFRGAVRGDIHSANNERAANDDDDDVDFVGV